MFATAEADRKSAAGDCRIGPRARCEGADFKGADLNNVNLKGAVLSEADLTDANLSWANLREADVEAAIPCNTLMPDGGTRNDDC